MYEKIIESVHKYYNNTCIILIHAIKEPVEPKVGIETYTKLKDLQLHFSRLNIRTAVMDIATFILKIGGSYYHIKRPLFVLLNDSEDLRHQFSTLIAPSIDMAYPTWLTFFRVETSIDDFFRDVYVPFDCTFLVSKENFDYEFEAEIITEVYQVYRGLELRQETFATWDIVDGIIYPKLSLYQRRSNLYGHTLRVISIEDPPSSMIIRDKDNKVMGLNGFFGGIMELLQESMNCTLIYESTDEWGYLLNNGTWTGAINSLIINKSDIFAAELLMTTERLDALKFTTPLYSTKCRTFIKRPATSVLSWDKYITPFADDIWSALGVIILISSAFIKIIKSVAAVIHLQNAQNDRLDSKFWDVVFSIFGALCSQGMELSTINPIRIVQFSIHLTGVVVLAAYSAALISSLAVKIFVMPFTTMEGLLKDRTYRFGVVGGSADFTFFQNTSDPVMSVLFDDVLVKETDLPTNYLEGLSRVCSESKYAFMALDAAVSQLKSSVDCILVPLDTISQTSIGMALTPDSPYRGIINNNILLLRDSGLLNKLLNSDWALPGDNIQDAWSTVEIQDILPLIVVLIVSSCTSIVFLCSERLIHIKMAHNRGKKNVNLIKGVKFPMNDEKLFKGYFK
ncbi:probable glutamate receptor [Microplitis mediator]|uniref:probable glutamate receptor n=1 Tax=Microplitis mediator TaxID=375433 RepID=UPI002555D46B|nr:probable glutamate receptor [Microplitis mediator]XP_057331854.1 probable glutamate receptor [Microplitis mediator]